MTIAIAQLLPSSSLLHSIPLKVCTEEIINGFDDMVFPHWPYNFLSHSSQLRLMMVMTSSAAFQSSSHVGDDNRTDNEGTNSLDHPQL